FFACARSVRFTLQPHCFMERETISTISRESAPKSFMELVSVISLPRAPSTMAWRLVFTTPKISSRVMMRSPTWDGSAYECGQDRGRADAILLDALPDHGEEQAVLRHRRRDLDRSAGHHGMGEARPEDVGRRDLGQGLVAQRRAQHA